MSQNVFDTLIFICWGISVIVLGYFFIKWTDPLIERWKNWRSRRNNAKASQHNKLLVFDKKRREK